MKRVLMYLIILLSIFYIPIVNAEEFELYSKNALLFNLNEDTVLYDKNSNERISIASMTKIMTAIVAIENIDNLDEKVTLTYDDFYGLAEANAVQAGFYAGEVVTYRDLLYGLLLPSGADAAQSLTRNVAGSNEGFVDLMNKKASELNLTNTHFANATGLDDPNHYSSLVDVSIIFKYALKNEDFLSIIRTDSYTTSNGRLTFYSTVKKGKKELNMGYLIGGKTGTTYDAGLCLASVASFNKVDYMLITARAPWDRKGSWNFVDAKTIYDYYINNYSYQNIVSKNDVILTLATKYAKEKEITFKANKNLDMYLKNGFDKKDLLYRYEGINVINYDTAKGSKLGVVNVYLGDEVVSTIDIVLDKKLTFDINEYVDDHLYEVGLGLLAFLLLLLLTISAIINTYKKKKK